MSHRRNRCIRKLENAIAELREVKHFLREKKNKHAKDEIADAFIEIGEASRCIVNLSTKKR